jgi:DNA-binding transcriptional LysR family regulator
MDVHLRNLRYFVAVAEDLSFSRAAERVHISQPALSKQVRQLERELRFTLFHRDPHRVVLSDAGEALLPVAREMLAVWEQALVAAREVASAAGRVVRVGFQTSVGGGLYQEIAARFQNLRPDWRLVLRLHHWSDSTAGLLDGSEDIAFVWSPIGAATISHRVLRQERRFVALASNHRLAAQVALRMEELLDEPFVALPQAAGAARDFWLATESRGSRPALIGAEAATPDETFEAVACGNGVVLLAEGNTTVYGRPGIVFRPMLDLAPCELLVAWRENDNRQAISDLVAVAVDAARPALVLQTG